MAEAPRTKPLDNAAEGQRFAALRSGFDQAAGRSGPIIERSFCIGGYAVRIRFANTGLVEPLTLPFRHLESAPGDAADLTISVWDSASSGTRLSAAAGNLREHHEFATPVTSAAGGILTAYMRPNPGLSMLDMHTGEAVYWLPGASDVAFEDRSSPLRGILSWWMSRRLRQFVHGAAVGTERGCVLIVGKGGSGKSTTALSCLLEGMLYLGDDNCLVSLDPDPFAWSVYSTAKLHAHNLRRLPGLGDAIANKGRLHLEKGVLLLNDHFTGQLRRKLPLLAVIVPEVSHAARPALRACSSMEALTALAPSTLLQLSAAAPDSLKQMAELIRRVPAFKMALSEDVSANARELRALLDRLPVAGAVP